MKINGLNKTTLLDYPGHLAATIFIGGCNMRCPFCHNASLVTSTSCQPTIPTEDVLSYLSKRKGILEGVCITGGEPTLYPDLPDFIKEIRELGFKIKLDTNGTNPGMIKKLHESNLIDYVAMDIKNSKEKYLLTAGITMNKIPSIEESVSYLMLSGMGYEFRTTVVKEFHDKEDMISIGEWIRGAKAYYLQSFKDSGDIIQPGLSAHSKDKLLNYVELLISYVENTSLRGVE